MCESKKNNSTHKVEILFPTLIPFLLLPKYYYFHSLVDTILICVFVFLL